MGEHDVHIPKDLVHEFEHLTNITMNSATCREYITERFTRMTTMMNLWLEMEGQPYLLYPISHCSSLLPPLPLPLYKDIFEHVNDTSRKMPRSAICPPRNFYVELSQSNIRLLEQ